MKNMSGKTFSSMLLVLICICSLVIIGCEGSDAKKTITDTINKAVGGEVMNKGKEVKKKVDQAMKDEARRLIKMDKDNKGTAEDEGTGGRTEKESEK
ncbi:MAG TPA: hypothetical protein VMU10_07290 [Desulfomonilia bacterium]|nr:hypothetical protein [Desulfomonilia bacterium]